MQDQWARHRAWIRRYDEDMTEIRESTWQQV